MITPNKQTSMIVKICFIVLLCTFVKIRCIKGQPDLVGDLYDGTSYGDDDEGAIHILDARARPLARSYETKIS